MFYFVKTPWWLRKIYPSYVWHIKTKEKILFLTFDDGPHPHITPFVLDELKKHNAKATFFCIGKNAIAHPQTYRRILDEGHATGNHTQTHLNGWKTKNKIYLNDIADAAKNIDSAFFRPPYGRITSFQAKHIAAAMKVSNAKIIMYDVLSADFDNEITKEACLQHVILNATPGSIIVFHDSEKAFEKLKYVLPDVLTFFSERGFQFKKLEEELLNFASGVEKNVLIG